MNSQQQQPLDFLSGDHEEPYSPSSQLDYDSNPFATTSDNDDTIRVHPTEYDDAAGADIHDASSFLPPSESLFFDGASLDYETNSDYLGGAYRDDEVEASEGGDGYLGGHYGDVVADMDDDDDEEEDGSFVNHNNNTSGDGVYRPGLERQSGFRATLKRRRFMRSTDPERRRRWKWGCSVFWFALCLLILLFILLVLKFLGADNAAPEDDEPYLEDDDFVAARPYEGIVTTPFDPYVKDDCYFDGQKFPNIVNQCQCLNELKFVADDTKELYFKIRKDIDNEIYGGTYDEDWRSCKPSNMALMWLSSGDMRDSGDLYQRFTLALTFFQLNGTQWDQNNYWVDSESECLWFGLQCNGRFKLDSLSVDMNNVHGELPTEIKTLDGLRALAFTRNHIGNTIPPEIFEMPKLESLMLYANNFRGSIPSGVAKASNLKVLRLENNLLFGQLVTEIGKLTSLEEFSVGFNQLWRKIPSEIGLLSNLRWLVLEDNRFSGELPTEFSQLTKLEYLLIGSNLLRGSVPSGFSKISNLQEFRLARSGLGGTIPKEFGALSNLHRLEMGFNNFQGTLMSEFGQMTSLSWLALNDNDLQGSIPTEFGNLVNMTRLIMTDLLLTGTVPSELGSMTILENLALDANTLTGTAPQEVCALRNFLLDVFVADCPFGETVGVNCPIPTCCTFCRRSEHQNTVINGIENGNLDANGNVIEGGGMDSSGTNAPQTETPP
jgi:hypothetical protein